MPALEARLPALEAAHVQPFGVSVDSVYCHANWAVSLGGVSFPLLSDFHPKGAVADSFGLYLEGGGIADRATVLIDAGGVIRHISSVTPAGERDMDEIVALCQQIDADWQGDLPDAPPPSGIPAGARLFVKSSCGFSRAVLAARANLHLEDRLPVANISEDDAARAELQQLAGKTQAPCLVSGGDAMFESADIIATLVAGVTGLRA